MSDKTCIRCGGAIPDAWPQPLCELSTFTDIGIGLRDMWGGRVAGLVAQSEIEG